MKALPTSVAILVLGALLPLNHALAQGTFRFTARFDGNPYVHPDWIVGITEYYESGMRFRAIGPLTPPQLSRAGGGGSPDWWPYNGTAYLLSGFRELLAVNSDSGRRFGVVSVDLSEFSTLYQTPTTIQFVGYLAGGSTVTTNFVTDGIMDGTTGPLPDFQTFYFDARFSDLERLEVPTYGWALDNMVFGTIPEPTMPSLLLMGACVIIARRSRHKRVF